jgi:hypothetical protein
MAARILPFRGTEADSEAPMAYTGDDRRRVPSAIPFFIEDAQPEPLSDDEREELARQDGEWPTTRRYARTLHGVDSAFPRDPEYAEAFDRSCRASFIEQDREVRAMSETLRSVLAHLALFALLIGVGVLLAWRG